MHKSQTGSQAELQEAWPTFSETSVCYLHVHYCDLWDPNYICYISGHLYLRIDECKTSVAGKHTKVDHGVITLVS